MGDPKFSRRKYNTPSHPWQKERIDSENELIKKYGLRNKTELWKMESLLRQFRQRSRILQAQIRYGNQQAVKERDQLLKRLENMGVLGAEGTLDDVLGLDVEAILTRRLQTMAYMKGLSSSPKQARQFIVHGHVSIGDRKITIPGYLVKRKEEEFIDYLGSSPIANDMHPARPKDELDMAAEQPVSPAEDAPREGAPTEDKPSKTPAEKPKDATVEDKPAGKPKEEAKPEGPRDDKPAEKKGDDKPIEPKPEKPEVEAPKDAKPEAPAKEKPTEAPKDEKTAEKPKAAESKEEAKADEPAGKKPAEEKKEEKPAEPKSEEAPAVKKDEKPSEGGDSE